MVISVRAIEVLLYLAFIEKFHKKYLKCLLSVPVTVADVTAYILSGTRRSGSPVDRIRSPLEAKSSQS